MAKRFQIFLLILISIFVGSLASRDGQENAAGALDAVEEYEIKEYFKFFNMSEETITLENVFSLFTQLHNLSVRHESFNNRKILNLKLYIANAKDLVRKETELIEQYNWKMNALTNKTNLLEMQINSTISSSLKENLNNKINDTEIELNETLSKLNDLKETISKLDSDNQEKARKVQEYQSEIVQNSKEILQLKSDQEGKSELYRSETKKVEQQLKSCSSCCNAKSCTAFGSSSEIHMIYPNHQIGAFNVSCNGQLAGAGPGWTVIQRRIDGSENFYRNWTDYRSGFGNLSGEFFIGLEKLHHMTAWEPHELYIHLQDFNNDSRFARYSNFLVGNEDSSYELVSLWDYSGDAEDAMEDDVGYGFSTFDRGESKDMATCRHGAWWHNEGGSFSNLNGRYIPDGEIVYDYQGTGIFWYSDWHDENYSFKSVQMMIRPKAYNQSKEDSQLNSLL